MFLSGYLSLLLICVTFRLQNYLMMEYDINDIPFHIEGVNISSLPESSGQAVKTITTHESSDENESEGKYLPVCCTMESFYLITCIADEKPKNRKEISKLSPHLKGLMGEANVRYARGDLETSKKMCFEVIRQVPDAYEPYLTLSQMYENTNLKKYKGYLMLASHLAPCDIGVLTRLADLHMQDAEVELAIKCYSRALKVSPKNLYLHEKRLELLEQRM